MNDLGFGGERLPLPTTPNEFTFYVIYGSSPANPIFSNLSNPVYNSSTTLGVLGGNFSFVLPNAPANVPIYLQMYAFNTAAGSYLNAQVTLGSHWGHSSIIEVIPSESPTLGTVIFNSLNDATHIAPFDLGPEGTPLSRPEPSTLCLAVMGALAIGGSCGRLDRFVRRSASKNAASIMNSNY